MPPLSLLMRRLVLAWLVAASAALAAAAPNVLFILTDQQCADALSARMGDRYLHTPAMDSLVARGTYFSRAYAANPLCVPSRNAMFTGRYPHETGVTDNAPIRTHLLLDAQRFPTLGTYFRRAGYQTAYFGKWHLCYDEANPATSGFEVTDHQQLDAATADHVISFLKRDHRQPFLLVASFLNPHNVCELPRHQPLSNGPIGEPAPDADLPPPPANLGAPANEPDSMTLLRESYHASPLFPVGGYTAHDWQLLRWGYYRLIEKVDAEIGKVLAALQATGHDKDTVIVFVSDHGEAAGAHGLNQKTVLYEEVARVPLVICDPADPVRRTADEFVNTGIDLLPTMLAYAGIAAPPELPGSSLRPIVAGERPAHWRDEVVAENNMTQGGPVDGFIPMAQGRMLRTARFKYAVYEFGQHRESLVDLAKDPGEMHDLARDPAYRPVLLEGRERLQRWAAAQHDPLVPELLANDAGPRPFPHVTKPAVRWGRAAAATRDDEAEPRRDPPSADGGGATSPRAAPPIVAGVADPGPHQSADASGPPPFVLQNKTRRMDPFAGSRLQINPPSFRWPAVKGATRYRVELSRDAAFADTASREVAEVTDPFYRPTEPLAPGPWYWRVRAETPAPGAWLGRESFTITGELPTWAVPDWAALMRRIPAGHPRLYVTSADLGRWRNDAALQRRIAARAQAVLAAVTKPFSLDPYIARTRLPGDSEAQVTKRVDWESRGAERDAAEPAGDAAWVWAATGNRAFLDAAKARALLIAGFDPNGFISEAHNDFANAGIVENLGICYDLLYDEFSPAERATIRAAIVRRARPIFAKLHNASQDLMMAHNWQHVFLNGMTGALAVRGEEPAADGWIELGLKSFVAFYPWFGGNDGGSHEGTRYYHATEMLSSLDTLDFFRAAFGLRLDAGNPWFRHNPAYLMYSFPPDSMMAQLGDSNEGVTDDGDDRATPGARAQAVTHRMSVLYGDHFAAAYAAAIATNNDNRLTVSEVLRWRTDPDIAPRPLGELPDVGVFRDIGAVFTHTAYTRPADNVRFIFQSSPYGGFGHGHADQNSFHVIAYNEPLLLDSGYYTPAGDPHRQKWSVQTVAHNTLLVDGTGQPYGDSSGYGELTHAEDHSDWAYWVGSAATAYHEAPLQRFDRHVVWLKRAPTPTYIIVDDVVAQGGVPRRFDWLLHATNRMAVDNAHRRVLVTGERGQAAVTFVQPTTLSFTQDDQFNHPAVYWRKGQNFPLPNQWHLKATPPRAAQARFFVVVQVARRGAAIPSFEARPDGVRVGDYVVSIDASTHQLRVLTAGPGPGGANNR